MTRRIFTSIFSVSMAVLLACLALTMSVLYDYFSDVHSSEIQGEASYVAHGINTIGDTYLDTLPDSSNRITVIAPDGTVLYDSSADASAMENHGDREEIQEALSGKAGESVRKSKTMAEETYYYAMLLDNGNVLRVSGTRYTVFTLLMGTMQMICVVILAALVLSLLLASRVSKKIVTPINAIDLEHPEDSETYEELAPLLGRIASQNRQIAANIEELRRKQQEFAAITENMSEGIFVVDTKTDILSYNSSALRLLGTSEAPERCSVLTLNRSESFRTSIDQALSGRHSEQLMPQGDRVYQVIANPVYESGSVAGAVIVILDVTEREEREKLRREFTANVSHELKTPLTSISGFAEIIKNGMVKAEDIPRFAGNIYDESQRLIALVGDIINLSRLDEGACVLEQEDVDLLTVIDGVIKALSPSAEKRGITIELRAEHLSVRGIRQILEEMIYNLVDNAIKYNREHGKIQIQLSAAKKGPLLTVSDTGVGIPYAEQERVFERFYRVNKSHSKEIGGTGLGLSIVKHGAALHNAEVQLQSEPGHGTSLSIQFE